MSIVEQNVLAAICIGMVIAFMGMAKNAKLKALIFSLPISITTALVATGAHVTSLHVIGLLLLCLFLWMVYVLHIRGVHIIAAGVIAAAAYVGLGYLLVRQVEVSFWWAVALYLSAWVAFMLLYDHRRQVSTAVPKSKVHPLAKVGIVSVLAYVLISMKGYLVGVVVTFPFAAVFAVVEGRKTLVTLASLFCQNSIAILAFFVTVYMLQNHPVAVKVGGGWSVYVCILWLVQNASVVMRFVVRNRVAPTIPVEEEAV